MKYIRIVVATLILIGCVPPSDLPRALPWATTIPECLHDDGTGQWVVVIPTEGLWGVWVFTTDGTVASPTSRRNRDEGLRVETKIVPWQPVWYDDYTQRWVQAGDKIETLPQGWC